MQYLSTTDTRNVILKTASFDFYVLYSSKYIQISKYQKYYFNPTTNKVLIGWHGSVFPPTDMDGTPLL